MKNRKLWIIVALSLILLNLPNGLYSAFDQDEPKYLESACEMVKSHNYITPFYNYRYRFDKPILTYWLIALGYKTFGINEFGGRFFISIFGTLLIIAAFLFLRGFEDEDFAFTSSLILLSLLDLIVMSSVAMPDIVLTFFVSASMMAFFMGFQRNSKLWYILASASMAFGTLTKGPVAVVLPAIAVTIYLLMKRSLIKTVKEFPWLLSIAIFIVIAVPWYGAIIKEHGYQFFKDFIVFHNIDRFLSKIPGHPTEWYYYLVNYFWLYFPWSIFFLSAIAFFIRERRKLLPNDVFKFCLIWFLTVVLFFQTAHTKLAHYLLPSFPAFAVLLAFYLRKSKPRPALYITTLASIVLSVLIIVMFKLKGIPETSCIFLLPFLISLPLSTKTGYARTISIGFILTMAAFKWFTLPSVEPFRGKVLIGKKLKRIYESYKNCNFYSFDFESPEIVLYFGQRLKDIGSTYAKKLLSSDQCTFIVTRKNRLKKLKGVNYKIYDEKGELLTKHKVVIITNLGENCGKGFSCNSSLQ